MLKLAVLLISLLALSRATSASCSEGQYVKNGTCSNCTSCGARAVLQHCSNVTDTICSTSCVEGKYLKEGNCVDCTICDNPVLEQCTNITDTVCSPCSKGFRPNADGDCDFDCEQCSQPQSRCVNDECRCYNGFSGIICDIPPPPVISPDPPSESSTSGVEEESGNRVVLIISIVGACLLTLVVLIAIVVAYYKCSKRPSHDSENSDESVYSSTSINSRTMLTNGHHQSNGSLQSNQSNGHPYRSTILPPPEPWNNNIASAIIR